MSWFSTFRQRKKRKGKKVCKKEAHNARWLTNRSDVAVFVKCFRIKVLRLLFRCCLSCHFYFGWNTFSFGYLINLGFNIVCSQRQKTSAEKSIHNFIYIFLLLNAKVYAWIVPYFREERVMIPRRTLNHPFPLQRCAVFSPFRLLFTFICAVENSNYLHAKVGK